MAAAGAAELSRRLTAGQELFDIADAVAAVTGGSVAIEDLDQRVLAYSSLPDQLIDSTRMRGILERRVPKQIFDPELYQTLLTQHGVLHIPPISNDLARCAISIRAGNKPLGTLWAIKAPGGSREQQDLTMTEGARLAAIHLLRLGHAFNERHAERSGLLRSLLDGTPPSPDDEQRFAAVHGTTRALLGLAAVEPQPADVPVLALASHEVLRHVNAMRPEASVATTSRAVFVLLADTQAAAAGQRLANSLMRDLDRSVGYPLRVAVAVEHDPPRELTSLRQEAEEILRVICVPDPALRVATLDDVRTAVLLLRVQDTMARAGWLRHPALRTIADHPHARELTSALAAWCEARFDVRRAATGLHVHPNTLRYRLRRFTALTGVELSDPNECLALWMELRMRTGPNDQP